jgi:hypothetical protein
MLKKIDESNLRLIKLIGKGAFGEVFRGTLKTENNKEIYVAVKVFELF